MGRVSQVRDYSRMDPPWPEVWFRWNTALAEALVDRFGDDPSFAGLYIPYEIDFEPNQVELYEKWIGKYLRPAVGKVKLLASPGNIHEAHRRTPLKDFPKALERLGIDILAPQDYGGRSHDVKAAVTMAKRNADALARLRKPAADLGITLWANCELFVLEPNPSRPRTLHPGPDGSPQTANSGPSPGRREAHLLSISGDHEPAHGTGEYRSSDDGSVARGVRGILADEIRLIALSRFDGLGVTNLTVVFIGRWHVPEPPAMGVVSEKKLSFTAPRRNRCDSYLFHGPYSANLLNPLYHLPSNLGPDRARGSRFRTHSSAFPANGCPASFALSIAASNVLKYRTSSTPSRKPSHASVSITPSVVG